MSIQYTAEQLQRKFPGPPGAPGFSRLADVLRLEGRYDESISLCQEGLRLHPGALSGHVVLGKTFMDAGRMEDAREQFEAALRQDSRCLSAMRFLAQILSRMQWADAAAGYYRSILEVEPWDSEIRTLLGEISPGGDSAAVDSPTMRREFAPIRPAPEGEAETFEKPDGFSGDVLEVNLNDIADDFLPDRNGETLPVAEESLEDALASSQAFGATEEVTATRDLEIPRTDRSAFTAPAPDAIPEPLPLDILKEEQVEESSGVEPGSVPISGQDVEDRLDTLFGNEDSPTEAMRSRTATWSPAPDAPDAPDAFPDSPYETAATVDFTEAADSSPMDFAALPETAPESESRVDGDDIEKRLDELFNLKEEDNEAQTSVTSFLPIAPGPDIGEAVSMGQAVPFGGASADILPAEAEVAPAVASPERMEDRDFVTGQDVADKLDTLFGIDSGTREAAVPSPDAPALASSAPAPAYDLTSELFRGTEAFSKSGLDDASGTGSMAVEHEDGFSGNDAPVAAGTNPFDRWTGEADQQPQVTGADVEAQLDKLFGLGDDGEFSAKTAVSDAATAAGDTASAAEAVPEEPVESDRTVLMPSMRETGLEKDANGIRENVADWLARRKPDGVSPNHGQDDAFTIAAGETMILPSGRAGAGESDADLFATLAPEDIPAASETSAIEMVDGADIAERLDRLFENGSAPAAPLSAGDGGYPEMSLFIHENGEVPEIDFPLDGGEATPAPAGGPMVSGEDVSARLSEIFEIVPSADVPPALETDEDLLPMPEPMVSGAYPPFQDPETDPSVLDPEERPGAGMAATAPGGAISSFETDAPVAAPATVNGTVSAAGNGPVSGLAPMTDEEDAFPEEEETPLQEGQGANVATVTLAEIYFQQGLREQALQIYRQLLEREPENDSARKRIVEIEATKPEDGDRGPGPDLRRPRPGLKVPKRKK